MTVPNARLPLKELSDMDDARAKVDQKKALSIARRKESFDE